MLTVLSPLQTTDGTHEVTLALTPEGLGTVQATVSVESGSVTVALWADAPSGHAALTEALPQLHAQLTAGGDRHVRVDLADLGSSQPDARGHGGPGARPEARGPANDREPVVATQGAAATEAGSAVPGVRRVDLRL
jgi:hypothetical protein